jgi:hypothetical protein
MPHVKGLGRIDLDLVGEPGENLRRFPRYYYAFMDKPEGQLPTQEEHPFTFCSETDRTWVSLLFKPNEELPECEYVLVGVSGSSQDTPHRLLHFQKLLPLIEGSGYEWIVFTPAEQGVRVSFFVKGKIRSPEGLMKSIVRRLHGYEPEEEVPEEAELMSYRRLGYWFEDPR